MLLPGFILNSAGAAIAGENDLLRFVTNSIVNETNSPETANIAENINKTFDILDLVPYILILIGILALIVGFMA